MKKPIGFLLLLFALFLMLKTILEKETIEIDVEPVYEYGILTDTFLVTREVVKSGQTIGEILYSNHIDYPQINKLVKKSKKIFYVRLINSGNKYTIMKSKDSTQKAQFFIYEQDVVNYIVFDLRNEMDVYKGKKEVCLIAVKYKIPDDLIPTIIAYAIPYSKIYDYMK